VRTVPPMPTINGRSRSGANAIPGLQTAGRACATPSHD
jgi:hypothetical protein